MIRILPIDAGGEPLLAPDTVWNGVSGDWAIAESAPPLSGEPLAGAPDGNAQGLRADAMLATSVLLCLMTDVRVEPDELPDGEANRGWPGDSFDLRDEFGERPMGSKLWLLRRSVANEATAIRAEDYARAALQTLIDQGAVASVDVVATAKPAERRIDLDIVLKDRAGGIILDRRFAVLWEQSRGMEHPLAV